MKFLGTGAAEMFPNPFCDCNVCSEARNSGALPRLRSSFMIDRNNLIDFGGDILAASLLYQEPFTDLDNVFITHTHDDHFSIGNINSLTMADKRTAHFPIHFYLSEKAYDWLRKYNNAVEPLYTGGKTDIDMLISEERISFHSVKPYTTFCAGGMQIFAVESNHKVNNSEYAINYLFDTGKRGKLLYAVDSGLYSEKNIAVLTGSNADILIMEGTFGSVAQDINSHHLNAKHFVSQVDRFVQSRIIKPDSKIYVTHINQCNTFSHAEYQSYVARNSKYDITVAYDGMCI